jgi:abequosyltransferase
MKEFLLTICIPTYNRSFFLKGLIENIFSEITETGCAEDVQILIVDGNSTDNTSKIVEELKLKGKLKYYRREKREGIDKDILKCIELSDGKYCWLFSDDDRLTTGSISHLMNMLRKEKDLTGCFCNRAPYDFHMERKVVEINGWPGKIIKEDRIFTDKAECFKYIGMDFGFISSQVVKRSEWQKVVEGEDFGELYSSYYLMVHILFLMMNAKFKWLYISKPLVKQRTGNDSLLNSKGVIERQMVEHNNFEKIVSKHYNMASKEYKIFFKKMVNRLPRAIANLKSQNITYKIQWCLLKLYFSKYNSYCLFLLKAIPIFFLPNILFNFIKKMYFKYLVIPS